MHSRQAFIARRTKQMREHIKRIHAIEGLSPYVSDLLCAMGRLIAQAQA